MQLSDENARLSPVGGAYRTLIFRCPKCQQHEISIDIWDGVYGDHLVPFNGVDNFTACKRLWQSAIWPVKGWSDLSTYPSIDRSALVPADPCGGWHGFIVRGVAKSTPA